MYFFFFFFVVNSQVVPKVLLFSFMEKKMRRRKDLCTQEQWILCRNKNQDVWNIWPPGWVVTQSFFCFRIWCEWEEKEHLILPKSPFKRVLNQKKMLSRLVLDTWSWKMFSEEHSCSDVTLFRLLWAGTAKRATSLSYSEREKRLSGPAWQSCSMCFLTECIMKKLTPRTDCNENARQEKLLFLPKHEKGRHKCIPHRLS